MTGIGTATDATPDAAGATIGSLRNGGTATVAGGRGRGHALAPGSVLLPPVDVLVAPVHALSLPALALARAAATADPQTLSHAHSEVP